MILTAVSDTIKNTLKVLFYVKYSLLLNVRNIPCESIFNECYSLVQTLKHNSRILKSYL